MLGLVGCPGFGKSTFGRQAAEAGYKLAIAACPARELVTYAGAPNIIAKEAFEDSEWLPDIGLTKADGFVKGLKFLHAQVTSEAQVVCLDTMSTFTTLSTNRNLSKYNCGSFAELSGTKNGKFGFWQDYKQDLQLLVNILNKLRAAGKIVIATFHQDVKEVEGSGSGVVSIEKDGTKSIDWDEGKVPLILGSMRDVLAGYFDFFVFMERDFLGDQSKHTLRVKPTQKAWSKVAIPAFATPTIPSDFKTVVDGLRNYVAKQEGKK